MRDSRSALPPRPRGPCSRIPRAGARAGHGHERAAVMLRAQRAASQLQNRSLGQEALLHHQPWEAQEAQAICSQVHPEHRNRARASDGVLTISRRRRRLSKITIGLVCKETKNTGLSAAPFLHTLSSSPQTSVRSSPAAFGLAFHSFSTHALHKQAPTPREHLGGPAARREQQEREPGAPALPLVLMEHLWLGIWQQPSSAWQGRGVPQPAVCHFTRAVTQIALRITSHTRTHLGSDSPSHLG